MQISSGNIRSLPAGLRPSWSGIGNGDPKPPDKLFSFKQVDDQLGCNTASGKAESPAKPPAYTCHLGPFLLHYLRRYSSYRAPRSGLFSGDTLAMASTYTATLTVTPQSGFNSTVSFACSGLPAGVACSFSPATVTPSGSPSSTQLTISAGPLAAVSRPNSRPFLPATALGAALCLFGWRKRRGLQLLLLLAVTFTGLALLSGCGSGTSGGASGLTPTPVNATVTITATAGALQQRALLSLTLN